MPVVATAGHVDHGKSALVRALTGTDPDRLAQEQCRGLTLDLGFAWCDLPVGRVHVVDVPGHQRYVSTMLAGVGPVSAVLLVIAADDGWSAQTTEHVESLAALGLSRVVVAVSRADLADPRAVARDARARLAAYGLAPAAVVATSAVRATGLDDLRDALDDVLRTLPPAEPDAATQMWIDRAFTIRGAGTVVTGTLTHGSIGLDDRVHIGVHTATVRALQSGGSPLPLALGVTRVAVNLRGIAATAVHRGDRLFTEAPSAPQPHAVLTPTWPPAAAPIRSADPSQRLPRHLTAHVGTAAVPVAARRMRDGAIALRCIGAIPAWRPGDHIVLRDPGQHRIVLGAIIASLSPGVPVSRRRAPTEAPIPAGHHEHPPAIIDLAAELGRAPLAAAPADWPATHRVSAHQLAAAERDGLLVRVGGTLLGSHALTVAVATLEVIKQPFTVGEAARALGTSRRVALAVLGRLDATGRTVRHHDDTRTLRTRRMD